MRIGRIGFENDSKIALATTAEKHHCSEQAQKTSRWLGNGRLIKFKAINSEEHFVNLAISKRSKSKNNIVASICREGQILGRTQRRRISPSKSRWLNKARAKLISPSSQIRLPKSLRFKS